MSTKPPRVRKRLRVVDADTPDIENLDPNALDFDDENRLCVVETVEDPAPEEQSAELQKRRKDFRDAYTRLKPAALAAFEAMNAELAGQMERVLLRIRSERSGYLLIAVRMPSAAWSEAFLQAIRVLLARIGSLDLDAETGFAIATPSADRWHGEGGAFYVDPIMRDLVSKNVVLLFGPALTLQSPLRSMVDVMLDLELMSDRHLQEAVRRNFDRDEPHIWLGPSARDLNPTMFDIACARAVDCYDVAPVLNAFAAAQAADDAKAAKAEAEEQAKKASGTSMLSSSRAVYVPEILRPASPRLADLSGYGDAAVWGTNLAQDVAEYQAGRIAWSDVDSGCLIHGPPGTGKTLFATALAATCGLPLIATSYAQWQSAGDGHLGFVIKAIRKTFETANENAPCVLLVDEIDAIRGRNRPGDGDGWWTAIQTCFLECSDGTNRREGVVIIGACNYVDNLDPAMIRSGRLDRRFEIGLPDEPSLLGIMRHHLPDADADELAPAATVLAGTASGADVARIARNARRAARRQNRAVTAADLLDIAIPTDTRAARDTRLVAVHEAGHAVAIMSIGRIPDALSIVRGGGAHGGVRDTSDLGMGRLADFEAESIVRLAGRAAEEVLLGEPSAGAEVDLQQATAIVKQLIGTTGLSGRLTYSEQVDGNAVEARLRDLYSRAIRLVGDHRKAVESLADLAIERRVLGRAALVEFAREHGFGGAR